MSKGVVPIGIHFKLRKLECLKCGYVWFPRKGGNIKDCPDCRSLDWNDGKDVFIRQPVIECPKCEHKWSPYTHDVSECPKCKQKIFRVLRKGNKCQPQTS